MILCGLIEGWEYSDAMRKLPRLSSCLSRALEPNIS
jgi:hypothetical protein